MSSEGGVARGYPALNLPCGVVLYPCHMRAHLVQTDIAWEDPHENYRRIEELLAGAGVEPGDFIVLPEMCDTGFSFNIERTADVSGRTLTFLGELSLRYRAVVQGGRTIAAERPDGERGGEVAMRGCNVTTVMSGGSRIAEYTKIHLFQREDDRIDRGATVITYSLPAPGGGGFTVCPAICYDLRFPELFRAGLGKGADVFAIGACWPGVRIHHWRALLVARAIENQAYVIGVNRVGRDPFTSYPGASMVVGPRGEVLCEMGEAAGVESVKLEPGEVAAWREAFSAWKDGVLPPMASMRKDIT